MTRVWSTLQHDVRLQWRSGFYYATAVMLLLFLALLSALPSEGLGRLLPAVMVNNVIVNGFYFVAGLILLEKGEGSWQAQMTTPLRPVEYLSSKALSLTLLSLLENGTLLLLLPGVQRAWLWLLVGIVAGTFFFTLAGFVAVTHYRTLNEFLLPSLLIAAVLALPLLPYFGVAERSLLSALAFLHPLQPALLALSAATGAGLNLWEMGYVLLATPLSISLTLYLALIAYQRAVRQIAGQPTGVWS